MLAAVLCGLCSLPVDVVNVSSVAPTIPAGEGFDSAAGGVGNRLREV